MTQVQIPWAPGAIFVHVICRLGEPRPDGADSDPYPDLMTQGGTVTLKANVERVRYTEADGHKRMLTMREMKYSIRPSDGELFSPATTELGVEVLSGLTPGLDPSNFTWTATVKPAVGDSWSVTIPTDATGTVDLVDLADATIAQQLKSTMFIRSVNGQTPDMNGDIQLKPPPAEIDPEVIDDRINGLLLAGTNIKFTYDDNANTFKIDASTDTEAVRDAIATMFRAGTDIALAYDDPGDTLVVSSTNPVNSWEAVEDRVGGLLTAGTDITVTYDDANNKIVIASTNPVNTWEGVEDRVAKVLKGGTDISVTYDDANNILTVASTNPVNTWEAVEDRVAGMLVAGSNVSVTYDDTAGTITIASTASGGTSTGGGVPVKRYTITGDTTLDTASWDTNYLTTAVFTMDGTGSWTVSYGSDQLPLNVGANQRTILNFVYDGAAWVYSVFNSGY